MMNIVSLITGCFNGEKFISRCFESILAQTCPYIEIIFVDDGSTDNSLKIAESFRDKFASRGYGFLIISQKNMGFYPQSGIKIATGKYITTLDIDDVLCPESIQKRKEFLDHHPDFSAVRTNGYIVHEHDKSRPPVLFEKDRPSVDNTVFEDLLYGKTNNWPGSYMVNADVLFEYYPSRVVPMDRFTQNLQILLPVTYQRKVGFLLEPLMHYMRHDESFTTDKNDYETTKKLLQCFKEVRRIILQRMTLLTPEIDTKLDRTYDKVFLRLAYNFNNVHEFNALYKKIKINGSEERLLHASINKNKIAYFFLTLQNKIGM